MKDENYYQTSDFIIAVTLQYFGFQVDRIDKSDTNRCVFFFEDKESVGQVIRDLFRGELLVEPRKFSHIQKETKGMIYN